MASLKKKGNRSKINRLKRRGELSIQIVSSRRELEECIDEIAFLYDIRQSAANGTAPFFEDAQKREFHLRLMAEGLLHCAVLKQNNKIVAALLSVPSEATLVVGVFAISARHAGNSPGKILMLLLAQRLVADGIKQIDLTPGGEWKSRFADSSDTVHELFLFFDQRTARAFRRHHRAHARMKRALASVGITSVFAKRVKSACTSAVRNSKTLGFENYTVFLLDDRAGRNRSAQEVVIRADDGAIAYPRGDDRREFFALMTEYFERLSSGWSCHTSQAAGQLDSLIWARNNTGREREVAVRDVSIPVSVGSIFLDLTAHRKFSSLTSPTEKHVLQALQVEALASECEPVYALVDTADHTLGTILVSLGFAPLTNIKKLVGFRKTTPLTARIAKEIGRSNKLL